MQRCGLLGTESWRRDVAGCLQSETAAPGASLSSAGNAGSDAAQAAGSTRTLGCAPCSELFMFTPPTMQDKDSQVLWWVLQGCDPDGYRPSPAEAAGKGAAASWVKNRNVILRWEALETALRQVSRLD